MTNIYQNKITGALIETPSVLYGGDWEKVETEDETESVETESVTPTKRNKK